MFSLSGPSIFLISSVLGIPLYGRSFMATDGPGQPFSGVGPGSWEAGNYEYRALPLPGATVNQDPRSIASWSYDPSIREMISFDDDIVAKWKMEWIIKSNFGGAMFWELSGDKTGWGAERGREGMEQGPYKIYVPGPSLLNIAKDAFGRLDSTNNWLEYGESQYENMRKSMEK